MPEQFADRDGIPFDDHRKWLSADRSDWVYHNIIDPAARWEWKLENGAGNKLTTCWWCDTPQGTDFDSVLTLHHLFEGSRGKSDQRFLFTLLCRDCHQGHGRAVTEKSLGRLLYLKWLFDREHTSWKMMAERYGRFLPDLEHN